MTNTNPPTGCDLCGHPGPTIALPDFEDGDPNIRRVCADQTGCSRRAAVQLAIEALDGHLTMLTTQLTRARHDLNQLNRALRHLTHPDTPGEATPDGDRP